MASSGHDGAQNLNRYWELLDKLQLVHAESPTINFIVPVPPSEEKATAVEKKDSRASTPMTDRSDRNSRHPKSSNVMRIPPSLPADALERLGKADLVKALQEIHRFVINGEMASFTPANASPRERSLDISRFPEFGESYADPKFQSTLFTTNLEKGHTEEGFKLLNDYLLLKELGRGSFGKVKLAADTRNSDQYVAVKIVPRINLRKQFIREQELMSPKGPQPDINTSFTSAQSDEVTGSKLITNSSMMEGSFDIKLLQEVAIMKKLKHPNIVRLKEVIDDPESAKLYFVMQYIERGPLLRMDENNSCRPLDNDIARSYMKQLCSALHYLHRRKIVHRDIKPDNILLGDNGRVYLSDFGVSALLENVELADSQGTPAFMAPELLRGDRDYDGPATDIWSLGVTFFVMLYGELPFQGRTLPEMKESIMTEDVSMNPHIRGELLSGALSFSGILSMDDLSAEEGEENPLATLVICMLEKDPAKRLTIKQCRNYLRNLEIGAANLQRPSLVDVGNVTLPEANGYSDNSSKEVSAGPPQVPSRDPVAADGKPDERMEFSAGNLSTINGDSLPLTPQSKNIPPRNGSIVQLVANPNNATRPSASPAMAGDTSISEGSSRSIQRTVNAGVKSNLTSANSSRLGSPKGRSGREFARLITPREEERSVTVDLSMDDVKAAVSSSSNAERTSQRIDIVVRRLSKTKPHMQQGVAKPN